MRVRDEVRMVKSTYQNLYDSSISYGLKKALVAEQRKTDQMQRIQQLEKECKELEQKCCEREEYIEKVTEDDNNERAELTEQHNNTKTDMRNDIVKLKFELDKILSVKIAV